MKISHQRVAGFLFEGPKLLMALFIVKPATDYPYFTFNYFVNQPMLICYTSAPLTLELVFKWFWFTNSGKGGAGNVQKQACNFYYDCRVAFFSKKQYLPMP